jgi:tRNA(adenine34) deaminase
MLAEKALSNGNPPVGSIIVYQDEIIGEGIEAGKMTDDLTNHAEILAIRDAIKKGHKSDFKNSTMYSTHEPCIMYSYLIRHHLIPQIIVGISVPHIGGHSSKFEVLQSEEVPKWEVVPKGTFGICEVECLDLNNRLHSKLK